jgi:hypothetical protein
MLHLRPNHAFEDGRADRQRAFCSRPWRRAAQRERETCTMPLASISRTCRQP